MSAGAVLLGVGVLLLWLHGSRDEGGFAEEAIPFRQALTLCGWGDAPPTANPHFFSYPSLSIYFHWVVQSIAVGLGILTGRYGTPADAGVEYALSPHHLVIAARFAAMLCVVVTSWLAHAWWRDRSRTIGLLAGATVVACPALLRSLVQLTPEILMCPLMLLVLLELRATRANARWGGARNGLTAGAICGIKYSALPFLLLVAAGSAFAPGTRRISWLRGVVVLAAAGFAFFASTPFAVLARTEFTRDVAFELQHLASGHLAGSRLSTMTAHGLQLWEALGPALLLALAGFLAFRTAITRSSTLLVAGAATFVVPACLSSTGGPERYVVPAIPLLLLFTWEVAHSCMQGSTGRSRVLGWVTATAAAGQLLLAGVACVQPGGPSAVARASRWVRANTEPDDIVVQEHGSLILHATEDQEHLLRSRCFEQATASWRQRALHEVPRTLATIPFVASGRIFASALDHAGRRVEVTLFDPAWRMVPQMYAVLEDLHVKYVVRNAAIRRRLETSLATRGLSLPELESQGPAAASFDSRSAELFGDADITIHQGALGTTPRGPLPPRWWSRDALSLADSPNARADSVAYEAALLKVFEERVRPFLIALAGGALRRQDVATLVAVTRLLVVSNGEDPIAIRLALIGLGAKGADAVWNRSGTEGFKRKPGESDATWLTRVLEEWGVAPAAAASEARRYVDWSRSRRPSLHPGPSMTPAGEPAEG